MSSYYAPQDCRVEDLAALCARELEPGLLDFTDNVAHDVPLYDVPALTPVLADPGGRRALMAEWGRVLSGGPGVLVLKRAVADLAALDAATRRYEQIIAQEAAAGGAGGDHFARAGANARIWNSLQKLCLADPALFARAFANPAIDAVCEAWLGPGYQMTAQVNLVRPGGQAQQAHRDYHLGFMTEAQAARFPARVHLYSPALTLQGAVAHVDMPVEAGPTKLLPFSQLYPPGYLAFRQPAFRDYFEASFIQLPLQAGDALFFNPALFHAGGENRTESVQRMANLLQVSSAMGRAMEAVDRAAMARALYPVLAEATFSPAERAAVIAATAEGYAFPTNLDSDPPIGGLAPETQAQMMARMLDEGADAAAFAAALDAHSARRKA